MSKTIWYVIGGIVILLVIWGILSNNSPLPINTAENPSPSPSAASKSIVKASKPKDSSNIGSASARAYTDLLKEYDQRHIQLSETCQTTPTSVTYKNGTAVMIDNRSSSPRVVKVGPYTYNLGGYEYVIATLISDTLPANFYISCGPAVNSGLIILQK